MHFGPFYDLGTLETLSTKRPCHASTSPIAATSSIGHLVARLTQVQYGKLIQHRQAAHDEMKLGQPISLTELDDLFIVNP